METVLSELIDWIDRRLGRKRPVLFAMIAGMLFALGVGHAILEIVSKSI